MHMALYNVAPDLQVSSAQLPGKLDGGVTSYLNPGPDSTCKCNGWFRVGLF